MFMSVLRAQGRAPSQSHSCLAAVMGSEDLPVPLHSPPGPVLPWCLFLPRPQSGGKGQETEWEIVFILSVNYPKVSTSKFTNLAAGWGWEQFVVIRLLSCVWLCDPMGSSMPGFPVLQCLPESAGTQVHWVGFHPTISSSVAPSALNLFQHRGLF